MLSSRLHYGHFWATSSGRFPLVRSAEGRIASLTHIATLGYGKSVAASVRTDAR